VVLFGLVVRGINGALRGTAKELNAGSTQVAAASTRSPRPAAEIVQRLEGMVERRAA
jgi:hypothetical protein